MINIAVIGAGQWGANVIRNFYDHPSVMIRYICEKDARHRKIISRIYKDIPIIPNYRHALNDKEIQAVALITPTSTHYKFGMEALRADKHLFVEKPMAISTRECEDMIKLAKKKKCVLFVGHTFKYNNAIRKTKEYIKSRKLGKIQYISVTRTNLGPIRNDVNVIWDLAPHDISILNYWLDSQPLKVSAIEGKFLGNNRSDMAVLNFIYPKSIVASVHVSWLNPKKTREIKIITDEKMLVWNDLDLLEPIRIYHKKVSKMKSKELTDTFAKYRLANLQDAPASIPKVKHNEPLKTELNHFIDCVKKNKKPFTDGRDGLNVVRSLVAAEKSIKKQGETVNI